MDGEELNLNFREWKYNIQVFCVVDESVSRVAHHPRSRLWIEILYKSTLLLQMSYQFFFIYELPNLTTANISSRLYKISRGPQPDHFPRGKSWSFHEAFVRPSRRCIAQNKIQIKILSLTSEIRCADVWSLPSRLCQLPI